MCLRHRHLREIDCSLAVLGGPAAGTESGVKSIHWTCKCRQKVLHSGCCNWQHNYYSQQRQAGWANEQYTSLRCLWFEITSGQANLEWLKLHFNCVWNSALNILKTQLYSSMHQECIEKMPIYFIGNR